MMQKWWVALGAAMMLSGCSAGADEAPAAGQSAAAPVAATVLGSDIRGTEAAELREAILTAVFDHYAAEQGIEVAESEVDAFVQKMKRGMAAEGLGGTDDLTPEELAQVEAMRRDMGHALIRQWKINRALYGQYGGRIIYQQLGPEPLDAYRQYLEEQQAAGAFTIHSKEVADAFWQYFTNETIHDFMVPGGADEARAFKLPPWEETD